MKPNTLRKTSCVFRVDKFKVPAAARADFLARADKTRELLRTLPGFVENFFLEQIGGPGTFNFVTIVIWQDAEAFESAKAMVMENYREIRFDPGEMFRLLGIEADLANYADVED